MSFLQKQSYECSKTELDLFEVPPTQVSFEAARIVEYYPISVIDNGPIEFFISGSSDEYIDLSQTFLYIKAKVEGTGNGKSHSPANNLLHAMFQQVDVSLNETLVTDGNFVKLWFRCKRLSLYGFSFLQRHGR
jgi:hypothetical protein